MRDMQIGRGKLPDKPKPKIMLEIQEAFKDDDHVSHLLSFD